MADPVTLTSIIMLGAQVVGTALVEEATKDAYGRLKQAAVALFGTRVAEATDLAEAEETQAEGAKLLELTLASARQQDKDELAPLVEALLAELQNDPAAQKIATARNIDLRVVAGDDITLKNIQGPDNVRVDAQAGKNFTLDGLKMGPGEQPGN